MATDPFDMLAKAVALRLSKLLTAAKSKMPEIDEAIFASLLITSGVQIVAETGPASRTDMAEYLRAVADALDGGDPVLPSLNDVMTNAKEPPF